MSSSELLVDRFVSASSADDARESLHGIVAALQGTDDDARLDPSVLWNEEGTLDAFLQVLTSGEFKNISVEQGPPVICQIYTECLKSKGSTAVLLKPQPGRLVQSLLDVICNPDESAYARVSSLQLLQKICNKYPSIAQSQLLEVPNGLHRLADLFREDNDQVRNELLLLAKGIAQWPSCAKIWVFAEVCDSVIELAVREGGLTNGNVLVMDCLDLLQSLVKHDVSLSDLVWQSPVFARKLSSLLDLRRGTEFLNPKKPQPTDDLDDILQSGNETEKEIIPRLTDDEENLLLKLLELIGVMLGSESIRKSVWKQHMALGSLMWELSLLSPPPPDIPHVCAVPSANLQQKALNCVAEFFASAETMQRHNGLDRLLYLVCTGGSSDQIEDKLSLSLSALHVIRQTLPDEAAEDQVLHTLAPPSTSDDPSDPEPTVVLKLLNTVLENVNSDADLGRRKINLLGSLGALGVFMRDETTREMMLRIASPHSLIDMMLRSLESQDDVLTLGFLRFLSEWMVETPAVVEAILSSTQSTALSVLFGSSGQKATLAGLLLGLAMEYMDDGKSEKYGGWTRSSILTMISMRSGGISGFMSELEELKMSELPWKACRLEEKTFLEWYGKQVLIVRSRMVQQLTGGVDADDDDAAGVGLNALQKLLAKQSKELEELRRELSETKGVADARESELRTWKRRVESNPTQLDHMLSEYTAKNVELEATLVKLREDLSSLAESNELQLKSKVGQIDVVRAELAESKRREEAAESENDRLRGELAALSATYSSLEEEYNRSQVASTAAAPAGETVGAAIDGQQPEGEMSSQGQAGSEADALRVENARLRNDARAADEWMQLAHQRMGEIGAQNIALQEELKSTKEEKIGGERAPVVEEMDRSREQVTDAKSVAEEVQNEQGLHKELQEKLEKTEADLQAALDSIGESSTAKEQVLQDMAELQTELQLARASATALNEERRQLELQLAATRQDPTEGELVHQLQADLKVKEEQLDSLRSSFEFSQDGHPTQSESSVGVQLKGDGAFPSDELNNVNLLEQQLKQQQRENKAAQEWMEKAVEHHQMLEHQIGALSADKEELIRQIQTSPRNPDNERTNDTELVLSSEVTRLEELIASKDKDMESLQRDYEAKEAEACRQMSIVETAKESLESDVKRLASELESRPDDARVPEANAQSRESADSEVSTAKIGGTSEEKADIVINEELRSQISELIQSGDSKDAEIRDLSRNLTEFEQWAAAAQDRLSALSEENETLQEELSHFTNTTSVPQEATAAGLEASGGNVTTGNSELKSKIVALEAELALKSAEAHAATEETSDLISSLEANLERLRADAMESEKQGLTVARKWQERSADLEHNINKANEQLVHQEIEAARVVEEWQVRCAQLEEQVSELEGTVQERVAENSVQSKQSIAAFESSIQQLQDALETAEQEKNEAIDHWSVRCSELDASVKKLETQQETLLAEKLATEEAARQTSDSLEKEQEINESLALQVQLMEKEVSTAKSRVVEVSEEAESAIEEWSIRCSELEELMNTAEAQHKALLTEKSALENSVQDAMRSLEKEQEVSTALSLQKQQLEIETSAADSKLVEISEENRGLLHRLQDERNAQAEVVSNHGEEKLRLEENLEVLRAKVDKLQSSASENNEASQGKIQELESTLAGTIERLDECEAEASAAVEEWEKHCQTLDEERTEAIEELRRDISESAEAKALLESQKIQVEEQLEVELAARLAAERTYCDMEERMELISEQTQEAINQWQDRVSQLESDVTELESQLQQQQGEATDAILLWERRCAGLEVKVDELESLRSHESSLLREALLLEMKKHDEWLCRLVEDYDGQIDELGSLADRQISELLSFLSSKTENQDHDMIEGIHSLQSSLLTLGEENSDLREKCCTLESTLKLEQERAVGLAQQIRTTKTTTEDEIHEKEMKVDQMAAELTGLRDSVNSTMQKLSTTSRERDEAQSTIETLKTALSEAERSLLEAKRKDMETSTERSETTDALIAQRELTSKLEAQLASKKEEFDTMKAELMGQRDALQTEAVRLADDFKSANENLQVRVTDEVSRRATDMATEALRNEVAQMRYRISGNQEVLEEERKARLAAEKEVSILKSDLAIVLRVNNGTELDDRMRSLVMKTSDGIQQKERVEIEELRQALDRMLRELESSRNAEKEALARSETAEFRASVTEQEVVAAKADVSFLTQSLEETREAESARVASFEYRIKALEEDRDVVRRFHADEVEALRNELVHITMEKDRILHSLKESEKTNTALVYATSKEHQSPETECVDRELSKLRTSNVQLLSSATEEAACTERRIREAVAAHSSLVEAEAIVERELRVAAETALDNVKSQLEETRRHQIGQASFGNKQALSPDRLSTQLFQAREQSRKLEAENVSLKAKVEEIRSDSEAKIEDLIDQCRRAQALALKIERDVQFSAEVSAEASKVRPMPNHSSPDTWVVLNGIPEKKYSNTSSNTSGKPERLSSADAYDFVVEQKMAIQEERQMYQELLTEHDDLLALLAQQDMEKASLNTALVRVAGQAAVDAAILEAEENAIQQFGKVVRLNAS